MIIALYTSICTCDILFAVGVLKQKCSWWSYSSAGKFKVAKILILGLQATWEVMIDGSMVVY